MDFVAGDCPGACCLHGRRPAGGAAHAGEILVRGVKNGRRFLLPRPFLHPFTTLVLAVSAWAAQVCSGYLLYTGPYLVLPIRPDEWTARITRILLCTLAPMLIGWVVGKCSKGREVATSLVAAAVLPYGIPSYPQISAFGEFSVLVTFTLAGAILCRFNAREPSRSGASHG